MVLGPLQIIICRLILFKTVKKIFIRKFFIYILINNYLSYLMIGRYFNTKNLSKIN